MASTSAPVPGHPGHRGGAEGDEPAVVTSSARMHLSCHVTARSNLTRYDVDAVGLSTRGEAGRCVGAPGPRRVATPNTLKRERPPQAMTPGCPGRGGEAPTRRPP